MAKKAAKRVAKTVEPKGSKKYPYITLRQSLRLAEIVKSHGGNSAYVPKSIIARELQVDHGSSNFAMMVASTKVYGLVEGHQELRLTPTACDYFFPLSEDAKRAAELDFLGSPPAFAHLINCYDGSRLPSINIISNELGRNCGVGPSWRNRATSFFLSAAQELGVIDGANFLRYAAAKDSAGSTVARQDSDDEQGSFASSTSVRGTPDMSLVTPVSRGFAPMARVAAINPETTSVWSHGAIRVETPLPLTKPLWDQLDLYVKLLKPAEEAKEVAQMVLEDKRPG